MPQLEEPQSTDILIQLTADVVSSYVGNQHVPVENIPSLIKNVYDALATSNGQKVVAEQSKKEPAVPVSKSIDRKGEYIICLEDGKQFKSLKRHIGKVYNLTPAQYREKWNLPADYPMVAPNYSARRSELAKKTGLGRSGTKALSKAA